MNNIVIGNYLPLDSFMHKIDPRTKLIALFILMIAIFIPGGTLGYVLIGIALLLAVILSKLSLIYLWKAIKPMLFMMVFLLVINCLMLRTGPILFNLLGFNIYELAVYQTIYISTRIIFMISASTILMATTKPFELTVGLEDIFKPLGIIKFPYAEMAMMLSIALRFIPLLIEETQRIIKAQTSRGVDLEEGKLKEKIKAIISLIVPLFVSAFQKATDLADAMSARGYIPGEKRTRYHQLTYSFKDFIMITSVVLLFLACIFLWWI